METLHGDHFKISSKNSRQSSQGSNVLLHVDKYGATTALRREIENKYEILQLIGKGSYGAVSKGRCKATGKEVALKILIDQVDTEYNAIKMLREI